MKKGSSNTKRNGYIGLAVLIVLAIATILGSDPLYKALDDMARPAIYTPGTYTASARGYGGPVTVNVTVSAKSIEAVEVIGEKETMLDMAVPVIPDQILAKQSADVDAVSGATLSSNAIIKAVNEALAQARGEAVAEPAPEEPKKETSSSWKDGSYSYEAKEFDENGYKDLVNMTIESGKITALTWDCVDKDGNLKSQLSMDGKYVMTESNPKWHEQAQAVVDYVLSNQSLDNLINAEGYTDTISTVSINLYGFVNGVEDCLRQASSEGTAAAVWNDGSYSYEAPEFDENGYKDQVSMTIKDNKITALTWDCVDKDGNLKSQLSMDGKYVMTESNPKWHEQAKAVVDYVLSNQSLDNLINAEGYTDTISTVSINLYGFVNGVEDCLRQASSAPKAAAYGDGSYSYEAKEFDQNGYKDQVTMTIKDNKITALTWDCVDKDGNLKSQLSMDGKYVMTESNPKWHEQAKAVVDYVLSNQSLDNLINAEGYTDTISTVSINLYGFVNGVEDCLRQASEAAGAPKAAAYGDGSYSYEAKEFDENGYKDQVSMTIKDNKITALTWDCVDKDGNLKSQLSMDGKYVMTESNPKWHEQAKAVVDYVLSNQSLDSLINAEGYTDTISTVSINLYGFVNGVEDCLRQASEAAGAPKAAAYGDGSYNYEAKEFDQNGYKDQVSMTIKDNKITGLTWDCVDKDGNLKSQLSMDGKYVMTESNPKWHEQAKAVVDYVLSNQSLDNLINAEGYTDTVSTVSINLYGFVNGVEDCLSQAAEVAQSAPKAGSLKDGSYSYEAKEFDQNGYKDQVTMTIKDNKITALSWDCVDKDGNLKSQLSMDGKYVMTESNPKWHEQAKAVVDYVLSNQSTDNLMNAEGYTDTVSTVSINLYGFVNGVEDCLKQAGK